MTEPESPEDDTPTNAVDDGGMHLVALSVGVDALRTALLALADGDDAGAVAAVDGLPADAAGWAAIASLRLLREMAGEIAEPDYVPTLLRAIVAGIDGDLGLAEVDVKTTDED